MICCTLTVIMDKELMEIVSFCLNDTLARIFLTAVIILSFLSTLVLGLFSGFVVLMTYTAGYFTFRYFHQSRNEFGNLFWVLTGNDAMCAIPSTKDKGCNVCGDGSCDRDRAAGKHIQPWTTIQIHPDLDKAVDDLLSKILKEYVSSWYSQLSTDKTFEHELRQCIRRACVVVLERGLQVDLAQIVLKKLVPAAVSHLDDYLSIREMSQTKRITFLRASVQHLGTRVHPATHSREREVEYLRKLTQCLLPLLVSQPNLHCQNFSVLIRELLAGWVLLPIADALADPYILNSLCIILLGKHQLSNYPDDKKQCVPFLEKFVSSEPRLGSALHLDLASILKDQKLLYAFMRFLKGIGAINILQFCLDVEEFNRKMLTPELSSEEMELLYRDAMDLFSIYFNQNSPDSIPLPSHIIDSMQQVLRGDVGKLRTSPPLFQAYEHAYTFLEKNLCPLFHASDDFYAWLCGPRVLSSISRSGSRPNRRPVDSSVGTVARISSRLHKIKGALKGPIEGHTFDSDTGIDLTDSEFVEDLQLMAEAEDRDLSAWRVSIPNVETRLDQNNKPCSLFIIDVQRIDVPRDGLEDETTHWIVERRYNDFYALEAKLSEFHGEFSDNQLPSKRSLFFSVPGAQFLESRKQVFEEYIQRLLSRPALRGSDLLYAFLRSPGEFSEMNANPDGLSRLIRRTVPLTLRKEKGQHLEPFLQAFFLSTESRKTSSKIEYKDVSLEPAIIHETRKLTGSVFGDNLALNSETAPHPVPTGVPHAPPAPPHNARTLRLSGLSNSLLHIAVCVYGISGRALRFALALRAVLGQTVDVVSRVILSRALRKLLVAPRLAHLIKLLEGAILSRKTSLANAMELEERASRELEQLCASSRLACWAGPALKGAFCAVQCPQLNKQLVYSLLDVIAEELFPELQTADIHSISPFPALKQDGL